MTKVEPLVKLENVSKTYSEHHLQALAGINLTIEPGEFVVVIGPSGCGKSTLLNLIAGIDSPTAGQIMLAGKSIGEMRDEDLTSLRRVDVGFIFQFFNLLNTLTVSENVALPLQLNRTASKTEINTRVSEMLAKVGMTERSHFYPAELSGGEMQRTAIARALIHTPKLVIADEPTGNLDSANGMAILTLLQSLTAEAKQTIIMATHSLAAEQYANRIVEMKDGTIVSERLSCQPV